MSRRGFRRVWPQPDSRSFGASHDSARYMIDCFDLMYEEGAERPRIMNVALNDRLIGRPARAIGLIKLVDRAKTHDPVWFCTGREIAEDWLREHSPTAR